MNHQINITPTGNDIAFAMRTGELPKIPVLTGFKLENVYLPYIAQYISHRINTPPHDESLRKPANIATALVVAKMPMGLQTPVITFYQEPGNPSAEVVTGELKFSEQYITFVEEIKFTRDALVRTLRANKKYIPDFDNIILAVRTFSASIDANVSAGSDNRANKSSMILKNVATTLPEQIKVEIPIFQGHAFYSAWVDVCFDVSDSGSMSFWFQSPELRALAVEKAQEEMSFTINNIIASCPGINIVYQNV
jgi:hypothetical protein